MPTETEALPDPGFDPLLFWDEHRSKIILFAALFVVALAAYLIFQITKNQRNAEAERMFAEAGKTEDYRRIVEKFPKTVVGGNAALALGAGLRAEQKYDESASVLRTFTEQNPQHPLASTGLISLGATLEAQGKNAEALDIYRQVATKYPASHDAPLAMISQAVLLQATGKIEEAKRAYEGVVGQFPESYYAQQAMQAMGQLKTPPAK